MTTLDTTLNLAEYGVTALALLSAIATLWLWVNAILRWGDPAAFASAMTWTVVTLLLFGATAGVEYLQGK